MSWVTPKTNWVSTEFYNVEDWRRVQENLTLLSQWLTTHGYLPTPTPLQDASIANSLALPTPQLLNKVESNLTLLYNAYGINFSEWQPSKTWYARLATSYLTNPDYKDFNRWEELPKRVKETLDFLDNYLYNVISGSSSAVSSPSRTRQYFRATRG